MLKREQNFFKEEKDIKEIWRRIKKRDFLGNTGLAVKNSIYEFSRTLVEKIGALIFTMILARLLMPELFGLYSLALSTIILFATFSDLGIGTALVMFISRELSKRKTNLSITPIKKISERIEHNPKGYYNYLIKIKFILTFLTSLILILLAYWISNIYYNKPIFYALLAGGLYLFLNSFIGFFSSLYQSFNNFKKILKKEIIFQVLRLIVVPLIILLSLNFSEEILFLNIILALSFCYLIALGVLFIKKPILVGKELNKKEKKQVNKFILPLTTIIFSGVLFGYIDMIMLGHFVDSEFIGYYSAAFALIGSAMVLLEFSTALFPLFSRLGGKRLERALKKSIKLIIPLSLLLTFITILLAPLIIKIVYGEQYSNSILLLRILTLLIFSGPLTSIYSTYFISKGKTKIMVKLLISTTLINIILNYILISILVKQSNFAATIGAVTATIASRFIYLGSLLIFKKRN